MSDATILAVTWVAFVIHVVVGTVVMRRLTTFPLLSLVNLAVALCVLGYWAQRWYGYLTRGVIWYVSDQALPLYALVVAVLALLALTGRLTATWPQWTIFSIHTITLLAAAIFFSTFRLNRLI